MQKGYIPYTTKGMHMDASESKSSTEFMFKNMNVRYFTVEGNSFMSITNEKGTEKVIPFTTDDTNGDYCSEFNGIFIGKCVVNDLLVLFTTDMHKSSGPDKDYIYVVNIVTHEDAEPEFKVLNVYRGDLNFSIDNPIECLPLYENENAVKVYWIDGKNQARMINLGKLGDLNRELTAAELSTLDNLYADDSFDFGTELQLKERVSIEKTYNKGTFPPGTIQYFITYYNLYDAETNIAYASPLYYTSHNDRAGSPEDVCSNTFKLNISNIDDKFSYMRIYSLMRTSINGTPVAKKVADIKITEDSYVTVPVAVASDFDVNAFKVNISNGKILGKDCSALYQEYAVNNTAKIPIYGVVDAEYTEQGHSYKFKLDVSKLKSPVMVITSVGGGYYISFKSLTNVAEIDSDTDTLLLNSSLTKYSNLTDNQIRRLLTQLNYEPTVIFEDDGESGEIIDYTHLLYAGNKIIIPTSIAQKDNTLFLGGYYEETSSDIIEMRNNIKLLKPNFSYDVLEKPLNLFDMSNIEQLNYSNEDITMFNPGETYRLGIQLQDKYGNWTEPVYLTDYKIADVTGAYKCFNIKGVLTGIKSVVSGYKKIRPLVVYPTDSDRDVICQGIVAPTMYRELDCSDTHQERIPSWIFRNSYNSNALQNTIPAANSNYAEIQSFNGSLSFEDPQSDEFKIDRLLIDLYSPEFDFDRLSISGSNYFISSITEVMTSSSLFTHIETSTPSMLYRSNSVDGVSQTPGFTDHGFSNNAGRLLYNSWMDEIARTNEKSGDEQDVDDSRSYQYYTKDGNVWTASSNGQKLTDRALWHYGFPVYMWHRFGPLNNCPLLNDRDKTPSMLKHKVMCRYLNGISYNTINYTTKLPIVTAAMMDRQTVSDKINFGDGIYYINHVDKLLNRLDKISWVNGSNDKVKVSAYSSTGKSRGYLLYKAAKWQSTGLMPTSAEIENSGVEVFKVPKDHSRIMNEVNVPHLRVVNNITDVISTTAIPMKYKSGSHAVLRMASASNINAYYTVYTVSQNSVNKFGGNSTQSLMDNKWHVAGKALLISDVADAETINLLWEAGDTYLQNYECLKTYPYTLEDVNSVIEQFSVKLYTRINLAGRYDRNIGTQSNYFLRPEIHNLRNSVYDQMNNFFIYRILDEETYNIKYHPNTFTWSKSKVNGETIDTWQNITLASTYDLDGNKGKLTALKEANGKLLAFQEKALNVILYNEHVAITADNGIPIELANSNKVSGIQHLTPVGVTNKWSIKETPNGLYFVDSHNKDIYRLGGEGLSNLSASLGVHSWVNKTDGISWHIASDVERPMIPFFNKGLTTQYNPITKDVYFITHEDCLCYNEIMNTFTSFYDYNGTLFFETVKDIPLILSRDKSYDSRNPETVAGGDSSTRDACFIWKQFKGKYNEFFGVLKPFYVEMVANANPNIQKLFTNLELRSDVLNGDSLELTDFDDNNFIARRHSDKLPVRPFDTIDVTSEHQNGQIDIVHSISGTALSATTRAKWRNWYCSLPRDSSNKMNRISSHWCHIRITNNGLRNNKVIIHDIGVVYYV